jgi:mannose-6-phosphate isomerase-like protein (cupin superfamily)
MFPEKFNPHYRLDNPANIAEIERQRQFDSEAALLAMPSYLLGGGTVTLTHWGTNCSIDAGPATETTIDNFLKRHQLGWDSLRNRNQVHPSVKPLEYCIKEIVLKPHNQLSLQRHRGREEYWVVKDGILTVIIDGQMMDVPAGQAIFIPQGAVHCMNNLTDLPIHVEELQFGICREADNIRLVDATIDAQGNPAPRPTYPITTETEFASAKLFAALAVEIATKRGFTPSAHLVTLSRQP